VTGNHEADRRTLLRRVRELDPGAEVYFDARNAPPGLSEHVREDGVEVHYCRSSEADRAILDRVAGSSRPGTFTVVSDDREVAGGARQLGAKALAVRAFFVPPEPPAPEKEGGGPDGFSPEDFGLPGRINLRHPPRDLRDR
jgi:hypothetical protein